MGGMRLPGVAGVGAYPRAEEIGTCGPIHAMTSAPPGPFGIYVHFPWCVRRCRYCAFATSVHPDPFDEDDPAWAAWGAGVVREWGLRRDAFPGRAHSVYFGGGTPSLAPPAAVAAVLAALPVGAGAEVTIEANPGTVNAARLERLRDAGVTRVSVGVQTFQEPLAALLGRVHSVADAREAARLVGAGGFPSWSVDLIFALPGQKLADLDRDLDELEALGPPHVSLYGLTFEPGTPLEADRAAGRVRPASASAWRRLYDRVVERLGRGGWERYEVSNFARPGHRAVHNEATWRGGHYAGLGPAAHGFEPSGRRTRGHSALADWERDPAGESETPTPAQAAIDLVLSSLRHRDGLDLGLLAARTGHRVDERTIRALGGLAESDCRRIRLTDRGFPLADGVVARVCEGIRPIPGAP